MRLLLLPLMTRLFVVGPLIVRFLSTRISPFVNVTGLVTCAMSKVMVVPGQASAMIWRNEPAPLSAFVVTTEVAKQTVKLVGSFVPPTVGSSVKAVDSFVPLPSAS